MKIKILIMLSIIISITYILILNYYKNKRIVYKVNVFEKSVHEKIRQECSALTSKLVVEDIPNDVKRKKVHIDRTHYIHNLLDSEQVKNKLGFRGYDLSVELPVEYRVYDIGGHMNWHSDTQFYKPEQYELVYTIDNSSDMTFNWIQPITGKMKSIEPKANSLVYVRANGARHMVSKINKGNRHILKFVYVKR